MPIMETVTIINKSGKVVSTGKHLVNIFKDAREAYNEKKASLQAEHHSRINAKSAQRLIQAREETQSVASSRHSRSSHRSHRHKHGERESRDGVPRPPLTERNLSHISEGSVASSRRSRSHHGSHSPRSPGHGRGEGSYQPPHFENGDIESRPELVRRHTDFPGNSEVPSYHSNPPSPNQTTLSRRTLPPAYATHRSSSVPDLHAHDEHIDMNLAYGSPPHDLHLRHHVPKEQELAATMSKLDTLLLEAHCLQHSATQIIANLQANPEAMAAVALTLAELSNLLTKMSPAILTALKTSSPAVFALLASPQFLIAGGVAIGVTVVMFGGFKIIKKIQANNEAKKEAGRMEEALVYEGDLGSIDQWRRGIAEVEAQSISTSVDGEFITPEAARQKKERIRDRANEERGAGSVAGSESTVRPAKSVRRVGSDSTLRRKDIPTRSASHVAISETGRSERSSSKKESKGKEVVLKEKKPKKSSAISVMFKRQKDKRDKEKQRERESTLSLRPKTVEF